MTLLVFLTTLLLFDWQCDACGESFTEGVRIGEYHLHKSCYNRAPKCISCSGAVLERAVKEGNGVLHDHCHRDAVRCAVCKKGIHQGRYIQSYGDNFHSSCYKNASKCKLCKSPLIDGQGSYHIGCHANADKCYICTEPLVGTYYTDLYDRMICRKHPGPRCDICQTPEVAWTLDDGRHLCKRCDKTAVFPQDDVVKLTRKVRDVLEAMGFVIEHDIFVELVDQVAMNEIRGKGSQQVGRFKREIKDGKETWTISVLYGLPKSYFNAVIAHELAHAWQTEHCIPNQHEQVTEGVAELIAYLYLQETGQDFWTKTITEKDVEPYASGFRKAKRLYHQLGQERFFQSVKKWKRF